MSSDSLALVLPTFQESATIEPVIRRIVPVLNVLQIKYELIVVDDASEDGTADIVRSLLSVFPQLRLVERVGERGLSGAILDGWASTSSSIVGVIDADLQHPPEVLARIWEAMENGAEVAVASRYALGATTGRWRWLRRMASSIAVMLCRPLQGSPCVVKDPLSGFFMVRRSIIDELPSLQRSGFKLLLEILVRAPMQKIEEIPFCFGLRQGGRSKAGFSVVRDYVFLLLRLYGSMSRTQDEIDLVPVQQTRS
jgi:dolichol-phosphate mannosyltransferase